MILTLPHGVVEGNHICGYVIKRVIELTELSSVFCALEHINTGARHIHIYNDASENTFSVAFKTVPQDSSGVAHILEHTVLCGSKKYPVRDPFFSMLKRSLSSFMNAFTASDWTMYPFSTQNRKDFFNLMGVYLDAVLYPNLDLLNFKQEGHRLETEADESHNADRLVYKGIVYNEMKGAMSSPEQVMTRSIFNALFPSTTYRFNSGGDPKIIPQLTHRQLIEFHRHHYHPSNAYFYTFGDIPLGDILTFIDETALKDFERIKPETDVTSQLRWKRPKEKIYPYPFAKDEDPIKKCQTAMAWLTPDIKDHYGVLCMSVLEQILLGNAASPLRKALIDSGLGTALSDGTGFYADLRDTVFCVGLKDVTQAAAADIERIIFTVLDELIEKGIDKALIESAIHQIEFHWKEVTNHPYPYGLKLLLSFFGSWIHGGDPVNILNFDADIAKIRKQALEKAFFEERLKDCLRDNPHRVRLSLVPDPEMEEAERRRVAEELASIRKSLTPADLEKIKEDAVSLKRLQESEEELSSLPTLELEDIPTTVKAVSATGGFSSASAVSYEQPTAGIFYFSAALGCGGLTEKIIPFIPFFCHVFSRIGTHLHDYVEMARKIDAHTGGIGLSAHARTRFEPDGRCLPFVSLNGKCLDRNENRMFDILKELIFHINFADPARLKNLLLEYRAGLESMIVANGHRLAMMLAARNFSTATALNEIWHGVHQLKFIKEITDTLSEDQLADDQLDRVEQALASIGECLFRDDGIKIAVIGESSAVSDALPSVNDICRGLPGGQGNAFESPRITIEGTLPREGWRTATAVSFVARAFTTVRMDHDDSPALLVISKLLRSLYLHREIREKGGAYGGFALYNPEDGIFSFASYRDPHVVSTLNIYDSAARFIQSGIVTDGDIKEAILQVCSDIDRPDPPGPAARKAFYRKIIALDDDARNRFKQKILAMTRSEVAAVAERYFGPDLRDYAVAVISGEDALDAANRQLADSPLTLHTI